MRPARVFFTFGCYHASPEIPNPYIFPTGVDETEFDGEMVA